MAQTIVTYCDHCLARGEQVPAHPFAVSVQLPGARKPQAFEVDACEACGKAYADLVESLTEVARRAGSAPVLIEPEQQPRQQETRPRCPAPGCDVRPRTESALNTHAQQHHGVTLSELTGEAKLPCPEPGCTRKFTAQQGVAAHQRSAHGRVVA